MSQLLAEIDASVGELEERAKRSLVVVRTTGRGEGAGVIVHPDGLVLTCAHVVRGDAVSVQLADGTVLPATVLARDRDTDSAALSVALGGHGGHRAPWIQSRGSGTPSMMDGLSALPVGDSGKLRAGQWVAALGHPWGVRNALVTGVVIDPGTSGNGRRQPWIVTDLPLRPGHSGGPLLDAEGRLVGINSMITGPSTSLSAPVDAALRALGVLRHGAA